MLKSFAIKAYLASILIQQVVGSRFFIAQVDKFKVEKSPTIEGDYLVYAHHYEQKDSVFNKTLKDGCFSAPYYKKEIVFNENLKDNARVDCEIDNGYKSPYNQLLLFLKGVGNNYLTGLDLKTTSDLGTTDFVPCLRIDDDYKSTTYVCGDHIPKDLIEVPKNLPHPNPSAISTAAATTSAPPSKTTSTASTINTINTTTFTKSSSSQKPTYTAAPNCKTGYCGKKRGNGPTGACCSTSDDCSDTCNSNGKCGVSNETGEPKKATCPV